MCPASSAAFHEFHPPPIDGFRGITLLPFSKSSIRKLSSPLHFFRTLISFFPINRPRWTSWIKFFFPILLTLVLSSFSSYTVIAKSYTRTMHWNDERSSCKSFYYHIVSYEAYWPIHKRNTIFRFTRGNTRVVKRTYFHGTYLENVTIP